jgi:RNA-directed DNA polymerase
MGKHPECSTEMATLLKMQKGKCSYCGLTFRDGDLLEIDHIIPKSLGGKNEYKNKQILHRHCHDKKTASDGSLTRIRDKESFGEEPCEVKVSSTVLKTSVDGEVYA